MAHSEAQDRSHSHPPCRGAVWWCLLAVALPAAFLAARLTLDLWGDEVYTLYFYAGRSAATIATDYSAPNNHILYSLLLRPVYQFSEAAPILRLPSFLFALGTLMLVFWLALRCAGTTAAVATTSLLGLNQMFLSHAIQVRGYSLQMLLFAALIALAWQSPMKRSWIHYCVVVPLGAALLYVMPTSGFFLFPTSLLAVWANWQSRRSARAVVGELTAWGLAWGCGLLLYWPVADQMLASAREQNTTPIAQRAQLLTDLAWAMTRDAWWLAPAMLLGVFAWRRRQDRQTNPLAWQLPRAMLFLLVVPLVIAVAVRTTPFVRNFCPLLIPASLLGGSLLGELVKALCRRWSRIARHATPPMLALLLIAGLLVPQLLIYPKRLAPYRAQTFAQDGYYNYYAADFTPSEVAGYLAQHIEPTEYYLVAYDDADHYDLVYYLAKAGLPIPPQRVPADSDTPVPVTLYYVVSDLACYDDIARTTGVPVEQLRRFPEVARFGYYRVHRSPTPMEYAPP